MTFFQLALAAGFAAASASCVSRDGDGDGGSAPRHVVVVSIDTLRADCVLGPEGSPRRARTPTLDALARDGLALANAHAHVPLTLPSHANLLTGELPTALALHDNLPFPLRGDVPTLASWLLERGFATDAVIGGQPLARGSGIERGFERYDDPPRGNRGGATFGERDARAVTDQAVAAWTRGAGGRRRLLFVHYFDPHQPYAPPADCLTGDAGDPSDSCPRYLGEVRFVDRELARLIATLRAGGERVLLYVGSDHGEGLGDHGERTHGYQLFESTLRVPMLFAEIEGEKTRIPAGLAAVERTRLVRMVDVLPTLLRELALEAPPGIAGKALSDGHGDAADDVCYVESFASSLQFGWAQMTGVRGEGATLLRAGAGVPASIAGIGAVVAGNENGQSDERTLVDASATVPPPESLSAWREALVAARARTIADTTTALDPSIPAGPLAQIGYVGGAADPARHALQPFSANAALPSPLARRDEIEALLDAIVRLDGGDASGAAAALDRLVAADATNPTALFFRARARLELEATAGAARAGSAAKEAAADLARVLSLEPSYAGAVLLHAKALGLAGEFDPAFAELARLAKAGESAPVEHLLGSLLLERSRAGRSNPRHDPEQGVAHLARSLELDPGQPELRKRLLDLLEGYARAPSPPAWVGAARTRVQRLRRGSRPRRYPPIREALVGPASVDLGPRSPPHERRASRAFRRVSPSAKLVPANELRTDVLD